MKGLLTSLITVLTFTGLQAQSLPTAPKLVVGLTIDQLRTDYLEAFSSLYGERGFKRLWKEGRVFHNAEYTFSGVDRASAMAAIYSGSTPSVNGIISNRWMDVATLRPVNSTDDAAFMGYYTDQTCAPTKLLTSTIADELKIATQGKGIVYAIAPFCDAAIFAAGHAGNGAFWINPTTGKWSGTTYYGEFPWWASQYNDRQAIDSRISSVTWEPVFPRGMYTFLPDWRDVVFKYKFDDDRNNKFRRFITSPFVNDEVNALAEEAIGKGSVGMDDITDLLALTYYAGNYAHKSVQECAMEIQDTYVRLDRSIANLLDLLDKKVGLQNVLIFVTSTGYTDSESTDSGLYKIPTGEFHLNRCTALLNMFLMATYGEGKYVEAYHDQQIYLNHKLLEQKQLNLTEVQEKSADFLMQFVGNRVRFTTDHFAFAIEANPHLLKIAIGNILNNACKYSGEAPVEMQLKGSVLTITDMGIGIPEEEIARVYQPFYRASNTREFAGHGIGLSLSMRILRSYGAEITITSEVGKGTTVEIEFP